MANVSSKKFTRKFQVETRIQAMQEIMQFILQFCRRKAARTIVLRCFGADIAAFPSLHAWIDSVKEARLAGAFVAETQKKAVQK